MASKKKVAINKKIKQNPWMFSTVVLAVLVVVFILTSVFSGVSGVKAAENFQKFVANQGASVEIVSVNKYNSDSYEVEYSLQGQKGKILISSDGEYILQQLVVPEEEKVVSPQTTNVPKSDKPKIELFIWSYCPYGVQAQEPLAEVASLLGNFAEFEAVTYYAGHGEYEAQQNKIQSCIQEIAEDKYWDYASKFVQDIYPTCGVSKDLVCDKDESIKLMKSLGIDDEKVMTCVEERGAELLLEKSSRAKDYGVTGSPTLVINGAKVNAARNAAAYLEATCSAFNDAPEECGEALSSTGTAAAGNC